MRNALLLPPFAFLFFATIATGAENREVAPPFVAITLDGQRFTNDSLRGATVLIEFWATWCRFCRRDERFIDSLPSTINDGHLAVLAVNVNESREAVSNYLARFPRTCKIVLAKDTDLIYTYAPKSLPLYVLIDHAGNIAAVRRGALNDQAFRSLVRTIRTDLRAGSLACCKK
jgi:thiol-disulfide isomerase/thioredoxin